LSNRTTTYFIAQLRQQLAAISETPVLDAQVLLAHVLERPRSWVLAHPEATLSPDQEHHLNKCLTRLEQGEPLPYVLGHWEFYGLDFLVNPAVLIPRPETELLVEQALAWLRATPRRRMAADVGTGSGCIAVSLAVHSPDLCVVASDISRETLKTARKNAARHAVSGRVTCVQSQLVPPANRPFDLICANLPYIPTEKLSGLKVAGWEPRMALDGGPDGLKHIRPLIDSASRSLAPGGMLLVEIEASQGAAACALAKAAFPYGETCLLPDLSGNDRLVKVQNATPAGTPENG
jgi:release factor glutamine methyltransferase